MSFSSASDMASYCLSTRRSQIWVVGRAVVKCIYLPRTQTIRFELDRRWIVPAETVDQLLIRHPAQALHGPSRGNNG